jgi:DNA-binding transcriptional MerR regulator
VVDVRHGLTIGEFSAVTQLSVRTLRRYHEAGLITPAAVDAVTGYRYYTAEQIPNAQVIHRLRELDVPLAEVKEIVASSDPQQRAELVVGHLRRLEDELDRTRAAVVSLRRLLHPDTDELRVELRSVPARTVVAIRERVEQDRVLAWYAAAMAELDAAFGESERTGAPGGKYANELFTEGAGELAVYRPVRAPRPVGRIAVLELPAAELAVAVHPGSHDDIAVTYGRLGAWVVEHALAVDGPVHETYLVGPRDTPAESDWRTEIGWPIFRLSGHDVAAVAP